MRQAPTIKHLRQNFIKKHNQITGDYFSCLPHETHVNPEDPFTDRAIFHPRQSLRRKGTSIAWTIKSLFEEHRPKHQENLKQTKITVQTKHHKTMTHKNPIQLDVRSKTVQLIHQQPSFVKAVKAKARVNSLTKSLNVARFPAHSRYLMKPCSIQPIKISERPSTATERSRSADIKKTKRCGVKDRYHLILEPWQTAQDQIWML